ncbi:MAG TPA: hypothetical protein PL059_01975 [Spirochaetota bacterium]|nr:hypothetical protein [Spirochaetota bacterium]HOM08861.1 hypothetical protein [Spirochaetota bacterium]HPP48656.1 hypothetical protein [Spirochaetota bacterium]
MRLIQNNIAKIVLILFISNTIACLSFFEAKQETNDLLPGETELYTWKLVKSITVTNNDAIGNISPDYYKYYNVMEIVKGDYQSINNSSFFLTVTIARTVTVDDAYGLFTRERIYVEKPFYKNDYSIYWKNKSIAFKGNIFLKVETNDLDFIQTQKSIIETILQKIQNAHAIPDYVVRISKYCDIDSIILFNEGIPQIPYLKNIVVGKKIIESKDIMVFFKIYSTNIDASQNFDAILKNDSTLMILESGKVKIAFKKCGDSYCYIAQYKEWIFGLYDIVDYNAGKQYINTLYKELSNP